MTDEMIEQREQELDRIAQELYHEHRGFVPKYPYVFVRVLDKEQQIGSIITPDNIQNKPVHEAIVLAVWQAFTEYKTINGRRVEVPKQSELKPGDHVLLPHWAGLPVNGYREQRYRVVKEESWSPSQDGGIFAIVDYNGSERKPTESLRVILQNAASVNGRKTVDDLITEIEDRFLLVDRKQQSITLSGV